MSVAKVSYVNLTGGVDVLYKKGLQSGDRFTVSNVRLKSVFLSRYKVRGITQKSLLVSLAPVWQALGSTEKDAWSAAGLASGLSGFKMFVSDTAARRRASISGYATPSAIFQAQVGKIVVTSPATGLQIEQLHPLTYYTYKKIAGTRSQYNAVKVTETFGFPIEIGISWHTDLVSAGASPRARFYVQIFSSYQGTDVETILEIPFGLTDAWQKTTASLAGVKGPVQGYSAFIEVYNARGSLWFDNVIINHTGHNWARDPDCNNVAQEFTKQYAQVPRHWAPVDIGDGAGFGSVYFN